MATSHTILSDTPAVTVIKQTIAGGDRGTVIDLTHARSVSISASGGILLAIPDIDANGVPIDTTDGRLVDIPAGGDIRAPTFSAAGRIGSTMMPPYLQIAVGGSEKTVVLVITNYLYGASVDDNIGTDGARQSSTSHG